MTKIQQKLALLRSLSGLTQVRLAKELGVSHVALHAWLKGSANPRSGAIEKIDKLLNNYGVTSSASAKERSILKEAVESLKKSHLRIVKKILTRPDILDELTLRVTYNSNAIEGSSLSIVDTQAIILDKRTLGNKTLIEQLEAKNHDRALRFTVSYMAKNKTLTESIIKKLHTILLSGIRDDAGLYRNNPVRIVGSFVPTANHQKVSSLMKELFSKRSYPKSLERAIDFHANFEKVHPFADGNGRIGRLILIGMLLSMNYAPAIITKKKRPQYYKVLQKAQLEGQYEPLQEFIYEAIVLGYNLVQD